MKRVRLRKRAKKNTMLFTDLAIRKLKPQRAGQDLIWDGLKGQSGLSLLVGKRAKTFRSTFKLNGKWVSRKLGRFGEIVAETGSNANVAWAREQCRLDRIAARNGQDPRAKPPASLTYGEAVAKFIEDYAKPRQRTWDQTQRTLTAFCSAWLNRPLDSITKKDAYDLLEGFKADGRHRKASLTQSWLRTFWRWAYRRDLVGAPMMDAVHVETEQRENDRHYSDDEVVAIWRAAEKLDAVEGAFIKLLMLLAPRKTALAVMERGHLDSVKNPTLWTVPFELTKSRKSSKKRREYFVPLPNMAQDILRKLLRTSTGADDAPVFPGLSVYETKAGRLVFHGAGIAGRLREHGAPEDFKFHAARHTIATWLETQGHSEHDRGLILNHAGVTVTAGYSHGRPIEYKRQLLEKWARHVASLIGKRARPATKARRGRKPAKAQRPAPRRAVSAKAAR